MSETMYDKMLGIKTTGLREWTGQNDSYNRYEPTPYRALEKLFRSYKLKKTDEIVDFGCGRGRVAFYIHNRFHVPVVGIEVNAKTYEEALQNKERYRWRSKHIKAPIRFEFGLAEHYEIGPTNNKFYFFNPFSIETFEKVITNILDSVKEKDRPVDLILYYPTPTYKNYLKKRTPFKLLNKVKIPRVNDRAEKFLIYRW